MPQIWPDAPSVNQAADYGGRTWVWNGYAWDFTGGLNTGRFFLPLLGNVQVELVSAAAAIVSFDAT